MAALHSPLLFSASAAASAAHELERLAWLDGRLRTDPDNPALRIDAFATALKCSDWEQAQHHLAEAQAREPHNIAWALREADLWLAQGRFDAARGVMERVAGHCDLPRQDADALLHNLAYCDYAQGLPGHCIACMAPRMNAEGPEPCVATDAALQVLWLRALHAAGQLQRACEWALAREQADALAGAAAAVASLIALDEHRIDLAQRWSALAVRDVPASKAG